MKIAILTVIDPVNIGNRLQNFAVQKLLTDRGADVETLYYYAQPEDGIKNHITAFMHYFLIKLGILDSHFYIKNIKHDNKMLLTAEFNESYIKFTKRYIFKTSRMKKYNNEYDYYCIGSDQIWNPWLVRDSMFYFGGFADTSKVFSLSASMGIMTIEDKFMNNFINGFKHVGLISVREEETKKLIAECADKESEVLLDPTLLIDKKQWISIAKKPIIDIDDSDEYLVLYFLGPRTESQEKYIHKYASENDLKIIDISGKYKNFVGPSEFLYLMSKAACVFTDSFHGTAFSLIFNRNFIVFNRNLSGDMSSRITTLLNKMKLNNHFLKLEISNYSENVYNQISAVAKETYNINEYLEDEKKSIEKFLNNVFK